MAGNLNHTAKHDSLTEFTQSMDAYQMIVAHITFRTALPEKPDGYSTIDLKFEIAEPT